MARSDPSPSLDPDVKAGVASFLEMKDLPEDFRRTLVRLGAQARRGRCDEDDAAAALRRLGDAIEEWWCQRERSRAEQN